MDYLDPQKKRNHRIRLYFGYGLLTMAVAIATVILVYVGSGYFVDRKTGDIIQNGQLFVNSAPDGATILLNGQKQRPKTAGRLVIPSGNYSVTLKRDGYRDWNANVTLDGGVVERLDYARLLPTTLTPASLQTFATSPYSVTESSDRRYMSLQFADKPLSIYIVDLAQPDAAPKEIILPKPLLSDPAKVGQLQISEWSDDSKHVLVKNVVGGSALDYILVNRESPDQSMSLTQLLHLPNVDFSLRDKAFDQYFVYDPALKTLSTASLDAKTPVPKLNNVTTYRTYGADTVLYVTSTGASSPSKMQVRLLSGDKTYLMREVTQSPSYLLAIAKLGGQPVMALGVIGENKVTILRNPLGYLKTHPTQTLPLPTTVLLVSAPTEVLFSTDASVVMARGGQNFAAHNFEQDRTTVYTITTPLSAQPLVWGDGKHLVAVSGSNSYLFDYNGANVQKMVPSIDGLGAYFDNDYQAVYGFTAGADGKLFNITRALLRPTNQ